MRERNKVEEREGVVIKFNSETLHDMVIKRLERYVSREGGTTKTSSIAVVEEKDKDEIEE
jgi:hypothetical protein